MAIESKIYIVDKSESNTGEEKRFAQIIAMFDACAFPALRTIFTQPTDCFIYADDGDTKIYDDKYGDPLTEASIDAVITCLENLKGKDQAYRRTAPLLAMLEEFKKNEAAWKSLAVLHFGY